MSQKSIEKKLEENNKKIRKELHSIKEILKTN
jgi:hypothetical protein